MFIFWPELYPSNANRINARMTHSQTSSIHTKTKSNNKPPIITKRTVSTTTPSHNTIKHPPPHNTIKHPPPHNTIKHPPSQNNTIKYNTITKSHNMTPSHHYSSLMMVRLAKSCLSLVVPGVEGHLMDGEFFLTQHRQFVIIIPL